MERVKFLCIYRRDLSYSLNQATQQQQQQQLKNESPSFQYNLKRQHLLSIWSSTIESQPVANLMEIVLAKQKYKKLLSE